VEKEMSDINNMSRRWKDIRATLRTKSLMELNNRTSSFPAEKAIPLEFQEGREARAARELGYSLHAPDVGVEGHDVNGVPVGEKKDVEVGLTEFPFEHKRDANYYKETPFTELDENQVKDREHFDNEKRLPMYRMKREEFDGYTTKLNPAEKTALLNALGLVVTAEELTTTDPVPVVKPVEYKELKTAPKIPEYSEPEVIHPADGKLKESITKLKKVQEEIKSLQATLKAKTDPINQMLKDATKPINDDIAKQQSLLKSYFDLVFEKLVDTDDQIVAYEKDLYSAVMRQKGVAGTASLTEVIKEAESSAPLIATEINKLKAIVENKRTTEVIERLLYQYPLSKSHEQKIVSYLQKTSEWSEVEDLVSQLKYWLINFNNFDFITI